MRDIVHCQNGTPRMPKEVKVVLDAEVCDKVVDLVHEEIICPEILGDVLGMRRPADTELIIEDERDMKAIMELFEGEEVMVRETGATVEQEERGYTRMDVTNDFVPGLVCFIADTKVDLAGAFGHDWDGWSLARRIGQVIQGQTRLTPVFKPFRPCYRGQHMLMFDCPVHRTLDSLYCVDVIDKAMAVVASEACSASPTNALLRTAENFCSFSRLKSVPGSNQLRVEENPQDDGQSAMPGRPVPIVRPKIQIQMMPG